MNRLLVVSTAVIGVLACATSVGARADSIKPGQEKFKVMLGGFLPAFNTDVQVDDEDQTGDDVGLGNDLGVDEDESGFWVGFEWRMAEKHRLGVTYSSFTMTGERVIDEEITIGDEIYPVDATITTEHKIELIPIIYSYSFINNDSNEFAVTAGIHWTADHVVADGLDVTERRRHDDDRFGRRRPAASALRACVTTITSPTSGLPVSARRSSRSSSARTRSTRAARS